MKKLFARITTLETAYSNPAERQQARRLLLINLGWLILVTLATPLLLFWTVGSPHPDAGTAFIPMTLSLAGFIHYLLKHGQLQRASLLFVLNVSFAALLGIFPDYRIDTPFIALLILPLTAAGILLKRSSLFGVALLLTAIFVIGGLTQIANEMKTTPLGNSTQSIYTTILLVVAVVALNTFMQWTFLSGVEDTLQEQRRTANLINVTAQTGEALAVLSSTGEELNRAIEQLRDAFGLYHVQVFSTDPGGGLTVLVASTGYMGRRMLEGSPPLAPDENSPVNDALRHKEPRLILDSAPDDQRVGFLPATRSELLIPLRVGNLFPIGVLDLHSAERSTFSEHVLSALTTLGHHLAAVLYSIQQTKELRTSYQERDRLSEQIEAGQRELARLNRQIIGTSWGTYLEKHRETTPGFDWKNGVLTSSQTSSESLQQTLDSGEARLEHQEKTEVLSVPIRLRGQVLGAVEFRRPESRHWSPTVLELVEAVVERLALSLENARLFEQAQNTAQREQLVSQITSQLQTASDLQSLLTLAAAQFQDALGATQTFVRLGQPIIDQPDHSA